jgi:hypothetical protein
VITQSGFNSKTLIKYYVSPNEGGDRFYVAPYLNYSNYTVRIMMQVQTMITKYTALGVGFALRL